MAFNCKPKRRPGIHWRPLGGGKCAKQSIPYIFNNRVIPPRPLVVHKVQAPLFAEPLEALKPYSTEMILAMQEYVPPDCKGQHQQVNNEQTRGEQPKCHEDHGRKRDGIIPRDVLLSSNPTIREQLWSILRVMPANMHLVELADSTRVTEEAVKYRLDKRSSVVSDDPNT